MVSTEAIAQAAGAISDRLWPGALLAVSTGAGMSRESGIPVFRGSEGVWRQYRAEEVATPEAFHSDPRLFWEFQDHLRQLVAAASPNHGHHALAALQAGLAPRCDVRLITQNVDRLHEAAGSEGVIHLHGDIQRVVCTVCDFAEADYPVPAPEHPPVCECGGLLRPAVVLFHEPLPTEALDAAWGAAEGCDVMIVVGTSVNVQPAASLPLVARGRGALVVEINPDVTPLTGEAQHSLRGTAASVLPELVALLTAAPG